jgi:CBS-domain-containing membrane protein
VNKECNNKPICTRGGILGHILGGMLLIFTGITSVDIKDMCWLFILTEVLGGVLLLIGCCLLLVNMIRHKRCKHNTTEVLDTEGEE